MVADVLGDLQSPPVVVGSLLMAAQHPVDGAEAVECVHFGGVVTEVTGQVQGVLVQRFRILVVATGAQMPI